MALLKDVGVDPLLPNVRAGQPLSARAQNRLIDRLNELGRGAAPGRQVFREFPTEAVGVEVAYFRVAAFGVNVILCRPWDAALSVPADVTVWMPYDLQRFPWHSRTNNRGITYAYRSSQERNATIGTTTVCEVITPKYYAGDKIRAMRGVKHGVDATSGALFGFGPDENAWVDCNESARYWSRRNNTSAGCT